MDFPGGPEGKNPPWKARAEVQSLVGGTESHMLWLLSLRALEPVLQWEIPRATAAKTHPAK